jgi:hypothetical protein
MANINYYKPDLSSNTETGLQIKDQDGNLAVTVHGETYEEITKRANKVLVMLNNPYLVRQGMLQDSQQTFDWGLVTVAEKEARDATIMAMFPSEYK